MGNLGGGRIEVQLEDPDYNCLYVQRLKKVVFRGKKFSKSLTKEFRMLAAERVHSKSKPVNFDDPEEREPYYERLFELVTSVLKRFKSRDEFDQDNYLLPARKPLPTFCFLTDYTTRSLTVVKLDSFPRVQRHWASKPEVIRHETRGKEGEIMGQSIKRLFIDKVMKRGEWSQFEAVPENRYLYMGRYEEYNFNVYKGLYRGYHMDLTFYDRKNDLKIQYGIDYKKSRRQVGAKYYVYKYKFNPLKSLCEEEKDKAVHFQVSKRGSKKVFRFRLRPETQIALHPQFRRLYLLNSENVRVELRVISYDALAQYIKKHL